MEIYFITKNKGKFEFAKDRLKESGITLVQKELPIDESRDLDVEDVVIHKAKRAEELFNEPFIIEDTGFYIESLNNFPGSQLKFVTNTIGIQGILMLLIDKKNRNANLKSALIFSYNHKRKSFVCNDKGKISSEIKGENLRGFNDVMKIFIPDGFEKTAAQMTDNEFKEYAKKIKSEDHFIKFRDWFLNEFKDE